MMMMTDDDSNANLVLHMMTSKGVTWSRGARALWWHVLGGGQNRENSSTAKHGQFFDHDLGDLPALCTVLYGKGG